MGASNHLEYEFTVSGYYTRPSRTVRVVLTYDGRNTHGRTYKAAIEGEEFGGVEQWETTFERRSKGNRYVNARWQSLRWYGVPPYPRKRTLDQETIKRAAKALAEEWHRAKIDSRKEKL